MKKIIDEWRKQGKIVDVQLPYSIDEVKEDLRIWFQTHKREPEPDGKTKYERFLAAWYEDILANGFPNEIEGWLPVEFDPRYCDHVY